MTPPPFALSKFQKRISWEEIDQSHLIDHLRLCVQEELASYGDLTSNLCQIRGNGTAELVSREDMIVCGLPLVPLIFQAFKISSIRVENFVQDGDKVAKGTSISRFYGKQAEILLTERTVLNFIQRLSGVATTSNLYVSILSKENVGLLDTRKTTPGLRVLEKYATACGGGFNHRMGLFDRILIKDNHLAALGISSNKDLSTFLTEIKNNSANNLLEIEIDSIGYLETAIDAVLLDNFKPSEVRKAVLANDNRVVIEASGGISLESLDEFAQTHPHFISTGAPIHTSRWLDIGLDWK
ncbi:MAG: carboxylating nicotinate-nucleotide diphosphorylase [Verrucomicrobiia bacterium]